MRGGNILRVAVCPGSFDPVTSGHIDILERTCTIFDRVIVAVFENPTKNPMFTTEEKVAMLRKSTAHLPNLEVDSFSGLLEGYMNEHQYQIIVRGLRALPDFDYEFQRALLLKKIAPQLETVFMMTSAEKSFISSSGIKELATFGGNIEGLVPDEIIDSVLERIRRK